MLKTNRFPSLCLRTRRDARLCTPRHGWETSTSWTSSSQQVIMCSPHLLTSLYPFAGLSLRGDPACCHPIGANVNAKDHMWLTPLHRAAASRNEVSHRRATGRKRRPRSRPGLTVSSPFPEGRGAAAAERGRRDGEG